MTQEKKELLIKDLCARLPYKQKVCYKIHDNSEEITETLSGGLLDYFKTGEKAVEWLISNANDYIINNKQDDGRDWLKIKSEMLDNFKKAMEE